MNKIKLIIQREYLVRVATKKFWLTTLLGPISILILYAFVGYIFTNKGDKILEIAIHDPYEIIEKRIPNTKTIFYHFKRDQDLDALKVSCKEGDYAAVISIPELKNLNSNKYNVKYFANKSLSLDDERKISRDIEKKIRAYKVKSFGISKDKISALNTSVSFKPEMLDDSTKEISSITNILGAGLGMMIAMTMYMIIFIYGNMVMKSVMEEKVSRIVEVMISSVKPFELMIGKILGVAAVGLTQILAWAVLFPIATFLASIFFNVDSSSIMTMDASELAAQGISTDDIQYQAALAIKELSSMNWFYILTIVILYFIGGYLLYASLFAAIGSASGDDLGENQSLALPVSVPIIIALYIAMAISTAPDSGLANWSSMVPFFSPIVMPTRLFSDPPFWQIAVSLFLLYGTALAIIWLASKIYRIGILMYGKKASIKEIGKWIFYS